MSSLIKTLYNNNLYNTRFGDIKEKFDPVGIFNPGRMFREL